MKYLKKISHNITDLILTIIAFVLVTALNWLSNEKALKLSKGLVYITLKLMPRSNYVAKRNLTLMFPDMSLEEKNEAIEKNKLILAKNILGFARGPRITEAEAATVLDTTGCAKILEEVAAHDEKTGILILIPHFSSFEYLNHLWFFISHPYAILARPFGFTLLDLYWNSLREAHGSEVFGRKGGFAEVTKKLKEGKNIVLLFDQNVKRSHGMFIPFFNHLASTTKTPALASLRTGCKIIFATITEPSPFKFKLHAEWIKGPRDRQGSPDERVAETLSDANAILEKYVKESPHEWFLIHRRFKTRPKGEPENWYDQELYPER